MVIMIQLYDSAYKVSDSRQDIAFYWATDHRFRSRLCSLNDHIKRGPRSCASDVIVVAAYHKI